MSPLLLAAIETGLISQADADILARQLDLELARVWAEQLLERRFGSALSAQQSRLIELIRASDFKPTAAQMDVFWNKESELLWADVRPDILDIVAERAAVAAVTAGMNWEKINESVIAWAEEYYINADLDIPGSMGQLNLTARTQFQKAFIQWQRGELENVVAEGGLPQFMDALMPIFGPVRAEAIAVTETTRLFTEADRFVEAQNEDTVAWRYLTAMDELVCFPAGTLISIPTGSKPIEDVKNGDLVLTRWGAKKIIATSKRAYAGEMVTLETAKGLSLTSTADHPVWSETEQTWLNAANFQIGDAVQLVNNQIDNIWRVAHFTFGNADDSPSVIAKIPVFSLITSGRMPVCSIGFNRNHLVGNGKIYTISSDAVFLNKDHPGCGESLTNISFEQGFPLGFVIARKRAKLPICISRLYAHSFITGFTVDIQRRAAAFLRTIMPIQMFFSNKSFSTTFADSVFGFGNSTLITTNGIAISNTGGNGEFLFANRARLGDFFSSARSIITSPIAEIPFLVELHSRQWFSALNTIAGFWSAGNIPTQLRTILFPKLIGLESLSAVIACFVDHLSSSYSKQPMIVLYHKPLDIAIDVYNLQVEDMPEFYANGILVHNCPICLPAQNLTTPKNATTFPDGGGFPPRHPRCRCSMTAETKLSLK